MNDFKEGDGSPGFICLKVSDKMPVDCFPSDFGDLFFSFLDAILAEVSRPEFDHCPYYRRRMSFANGDQFDLVRRTATGCRGRGDLLAYRCKACSQLFLRRGNGSHTSESIRPLLPNHNNPIAEMRWKRH